MVVKKFQDYTKGEQRNLLMHWWYYYSKMPSNFLECNKFRKAIEKDPIRVMNIVFMNTVEGHGNEVILEKFRRNTFDEYWDEMGEFFKKEEFRSLYDAGERYLIEEIADSYRNPQTRDEKTKDLIISAVSKIILSRGYELSSERVNELYTACLINEEDFFMGELMCDFAVGEGIGGLSFFSVERLDEYREDINQCIMMMPGLNRGNSCVKLLKDKNDDKWTDDIEDLDKLIKLGVALGVLYLPVPREEWHNMPKGLPIVASVYLPEDTRVVGMHATEYQKVLKIVSTEGQRQ